MPMERTSSNESVHLRDASQEHLYSLNPTASDCGGMSIADLLSLPNQLTPTSESSGFDPDCWDALLMGDNSPLDALLPVNTCPGGFPMGGSDTSLEQSFKELDQMTGGALSGNDDPFFSSLDAGNAAIGGAFDIDNIFAATATTTAPALAALAAESTAASAATAAGAPLAPQVQAQLEQFQQWLATIQSKPAPPPSAVSSSPPAAAAAADDCSPSGPALTSSPSAGPTHAGGVPSPSSSGSDAGYDSNGSPAYTIGDQLSPVTVAAASSCGGASAATADVISSPRDIADNLVRGSHSAARALGESILQTPGVPTSGRSTSSSASSSSSAMSPGASSASADSDDETLSLEEKEQEKMSGPTAFNSESGMFWGKHRYITDEEKEVMEAEGLTVPKQLPFNHAEVKAVKVVRRKIKNKLSAYESRRKKKQYIEGLEQRVKSSSTDNDRLQKRVQLLESQNKSLVSQLSGIHSQLASGLMAAIPTKKTSSQFGLMLFALCFVFMLPSMPMDGMASVLSAKTSHAVSQMPTTSPAATAFEYRVKKHMSRTLLGYSLPTGAPDLEDAKGSLDAPMHYINERMAQQSNDTAGSLAAQAALPSAINVHAGRILIERIKVPRVVMAA